MAGALRCDLVGSVSRRAFVEGSPAALSVRRTANGWIHPLVALEDSPGGRCASVIDSGDDEGAATSHAFGVKMGLAFGYAWRWPAPRA
jgi:hypothetical protein